MALLYFGFLAGFFLFARACSGRPGETTKRLCQISEQIVTLILGNLELTVPAWLQL